MQQTWYFPPNDKQCRHGKRWYILDNIKSIIYVTRKALMTGYLSKDVFTALSACSAFLILRFTSFSSAKDIRDRAKSTPLHRLGHFEQAYPNVQIVCVFCTHSVWKSNPPIHHLPLFIIWNVSSSLWLSKRTSQAVITVSETHKFWYNFISHSFPASMCCVNLDAFWANGSSDSPVTLTSRIRSADQKKRPCLSGSARCRPPGWFRTVKHRR